MIAARTPLAILVIAAVLLAMLVAGGGALAVALVPLGCVVLAAIAAQTTRAARSALPAPVLATLFRVRPRSSLPSAR